ncbi:hypothetical protein HEP87_43100 [Streptomyces sp. S1D4-11]|nr:hypothetical protein [Streptomyces sp. S1D4-11]QIY99467.1 hypothetical protein HEP87_43100 [Streptomyces sp. S1D4-11]
MSELELSGLPEVAALATALTTLFNGLEIPQQRYAARVIMDKSTVSRFLNGRRVATQEFIDRLLSELERHRKAPITEETRVRIRGLRLSALKVTDPQVFELEDLREKINISHRVIRQYQRQQEALELLLDKKEADAQNATRELEQLRTDWVSERIQSEASILELSGENERNNDERESLKEEIEELRVQLAQVLSLRNEAEARCADLEEKLAQAEIKLAEKMDERKEYDFPFTPEEVSNSVAQCYKEQRFHDAARMLSLAAAHFSDEDVVELWKQVARLRRFSLDALRLLDDAIRFGTIEEAARISEAVLKEKSTLAWTNLPQLLATSISNSKSVEDLRLLYDRWGSGGPLYGILREALTHWAESASPVHVFEFLNLLQSRNDSTIKIRILHVCGARSMEDVLDLVSMYIEIQAEEEINLLVRRWYNRIPLWQRESRRKDWRSRAGNKIRTDALASLFDEKLFKRGGADINPMAFY